MDLSRIKEFLTKYGLFIVIALFLLALLLPMQIMIDYDSGVLDDTYILFSFFGINIDHSGSDSGTFRFGPAENISSELNSAYYIGCVVMMIALIIGIVLLTVSILLQSKLRVNFIKIFRAVGFAALLFAFVAMIRLTLAMGGSPIILFYEDPDAWNYYPSIGFYMGIIGAIFGGIILKMTDWEALS